MRNKKFIISILIVIITSMLSTFHSCQKQQGYKILTGYEGMASYIETARSHPNADLDSLYRHYLMPYWKECGEGGELSKYNKEGFFEPVLDLDALDSAIQILRESNIEQVLEKKITKITNLLPGPEITVGIFALDPQEAFERKNMNRPSVKGFCAGSRQIILYAYPENDWIQRLLRALTHEYHHSVWTYNKTQQDKFYIDKIDLLSHMIMEGMAESFVEIVFTDVVRLKNSIRG